MVLEDYKKEGRRVRERGGGREGESFGVCFENEPKEKFEVNLRSKGVKDYYQEVLF